MQVLITGFIQVCEYTLAKEILCKAGMGQRREDGDTLAVFPERGECHAFYVKRGLQEDNKRLLTVDEGSYSDALHRKGASSVPATDFRTGAPKASEDTEVGYSWQHYEYVDFGDLLSVLVRKLVPEAKYTPSPYMGAGKSQMHHIEQSVEFLRIWSEMNPTHALKFV